MEEKPVEQPVQPTKERKPRKKKEQPPEPKFEIKRGKFVVEFK